MVSRVSLAGGFPSVPAGASPGVPCKCFFLPSVPADGSPSVPVGGFPSVLANVSPSVPC